jgi:hypothetical protein
MATRAPNHDMPALYEECNDHGPSGPIDPATVERADAL